MSDKKEVRIGAPKQDVYSGEEVAEMFKANRFNRGTYIFDCDGEGSYKVSRFQKQWVQKQTQF